MDYNGIRGGYVDWVHVAQDTDEWRAAVCTVMNFVFYSKWETSRIAEKL